eukprot:m.17001 g.17001  ORF g.17001 m.17001 type:complete len:173 (-) comp11299_c0_seq1:327-845(-)
MQLRSATPRKVAPPSRVKKSPGKAGKKSSTLKPGQPDLSPETIQTKEEIKRKTIPPPVTGTQHGGRPVSGRWWKPVEVARNTAFIQKAKCNKLGKAWNKRKKQEKNRKDLITLEQDLRSQAATRKQEARERITTKNLQKEENERKSQVVQVITDTRKIKKMSRKQLRNIEQR